MILKALPMHLRLSSPRRTDSAKNEFGLKARSTVGTGSVSLSYRSTRLALPPAQRHRHIFHRILSIPSPLQFEKGPPYLEQSISLPGFKLQLLRQALSGGRDPISCQGE